LSPITQERGSHWHRLRHRLLRPRLPAEFAWLIPRIRPLLHWHLASFLSITAGSLLALVSPLLLKWLIDSIIPEKSMQLLLVAVVLIFLANQARVALTSLGSYVMVSASQKMTLTLRMALLEHLDTLSADYYEETPVGAAMYPLKEPIEEIAYFGSDLLPAILRMLLTTVFTLSAMSALSPLLTVAVLPLIPFFLATRQYFRRKLANAADTAQSDQLAWNSFLEEHLSSVISIQLLGQEKRQERRAFQLLARSVRSQQRLFQTAAWFTVGSSMAVVLATCAVIGYGGRSVVVGTLSVGSLVAFYGFVSQLFEPLSGASELYARAQKTFASIRQVEAALSLRPSVGNAGRALILSRQHPADIEFAAVEFGYSRNKEFLRVPFLRIIAGEHIAILGENGAGKSTLVKLMARLYDPAGGWIGLGGEDIRNIHLKSLRHTVCYLPRDPVLFDGTIGSNLRFVRLAASEQDLEEAIRMVGLSSLLASLPDGLGQRIGPDGCQLSGGERQRLALARALLQKPRVLILDEATSCLDTSAEATILGRLREISEWTLIVISHRLSTFQSFGRVLTLSGGRIVEDGKIASVVAGPAVSSPELARGPLNVA
jgi:ABC-type bacteriocin/lantibiotic exporter with double-glycine peptidase domain